MGGKASGYSGKSVSVPLGDGLTLIAPHPSTLPSAARADRLRWLYKVHVHHPGGHWKGSCEALVPARLESDVAEAMEFMGSLVDTREALGGWVKLSSKGYWAHGF